jgi:hypothetical protein
VCISWKILKPEESKWITTIDLWGTPIKRSSTLGGIYAKEVESLNLLNLEGSKSVIAIDLKGGYASIDDEYLGVHVKGGKGSFTHSWPRQKKDRSQPSIKRQSLRSKYRWSCLIVGLESDGYLKILEGATIETMVFPKGYIVADSELHGEKWCGLKPL